MSRSGHGQVFKRSEVIEIESPLHSRRGAGRADRKILSPVQRRMGRAALCIGVRELARLARTTPKTLCKFENGTDVHPIIKRSLRAVLE